MHKDVLKVFVGYDPVESVAWHTMVESILRQSTVPVALVPVNLRNLKTIFTRRPDGKQSNEFSISRFLVPYLTGYVGHAVYFDCDMMLRCDISTLFDVIKSQPGKAVYVVKHDYEPRNHTKYLNTTQYRYPRKNWSSVVLWNCGHAANRSVDPAYVNTASAMQLHRFMWLKDEEIGELDIRWNWLVGEYVDPPLDVKNVHWTLGGPYFTEYRNVDFSDEWQEQFRNITYCSQRDKE